ncbi:hypothetical protein MHU86_11558 [Fragilaria crotonensis]|nr:hypothetical protein MHU86_11558 [Fragilaria crotonensis]
MQDDHEEGEELTPDDLMIAAKNKYDKMVEKGTWNAPTAEEKIVALEAKFNSTMKSLNKKVSHESPKKKKAAKSGGDKQSSKKKEGDHPKKWKAPKPGDKKEVDFQGHMWYWCGKDTGGKCEVASSQAGRMQGLAADAAGDKCKRESTGSDKKKAIEKKLKVAKAYVAKMEQSVEKDTTEDEDSE